MSMKDQNDLSPGNLVRITRNAIGVPAGTIALCLKRYKKRGDYSDGLEIWSVQLVGCEHNGAERRYLDVDLVKV